LSRDAQKSVAGALPEFQAIKSPHGAGVLSVIIFIIFVVLCDPQYNLTQAELLNLLLLSIA
jgi:hypothetical protein